MIINVLNTIIERSNFSSNGESGIFIVRDCKVSGPVPGVSDDVTLNH